MKDSLEALSELGRHDVVQDGVDGGVDVEHDPREVEEQVEGFHINDIENIDLQSHDPQGEDLEGQHAREEEADHGEQHCHHLFPGSQNRSAIRDDLIHRKLQESLQQAASLESQLTCSSPSVEGPGTRLRAMLK